MWHVPQFFLPPLRVSSFNILTPPPRFRWVLTPFFIFFKRPRGAEKVVYPPVFAVNRQHFVWASARWRRCCPMTTETHTVVENVKKWQNHQTRKGVYTEWCHLTHPTRKGGKIILASDTQRDKDNIII